MDREDASRGFVPIHNAHYHGRSMVTSSKAPRARSARPAANVLLPTARWLDLMGMPLLRRAPTWSEVRVGAEGEERG